MGNTAPRPPVFVYGSPLLATLDDDLQHDPFQLDVMLKAMQENELDLVYGIYEKRHHSLFRTFSSNTLKKILFSDGRDYSAATSFRLTRSNVVSVFKNMQVPVLFVDEYLIQYSRKHAGCVVLHSPRKWANPTTPVLSCSRWRWKSCCSTRPFRSSSLRGLGC